MNDHHYRPLREIEEEQGMCWWEPLAALALVVVVIVTLSLPAVVQ